MYNRHNILFSYYSKYSKRGGWINMDGEDIPTIEENMVLYPLPVNTHGGVYSEDIAISVNKYYSNYLSKNMTLAIKGMNNPTHVFNIIPIENGILTPMWNHGTFTAVYQINDINFSIVDESKLILRLYPRNVTQVNYTFVMDTNHANNDQKTKDEYIKYNQYLPKIYFYGTLYEDPESLQIPSYTAQVNSLLPLPSNNDLIPPEAVPVDLIPPEAVPVDLFPPEVEAVPVPVDSNFNFSPQDGIPLPRQEFKFDDAPPIQNVIDDSDPFTFSGGSQHHIHEQSPIDSSKILNPISVDSLNSIVDYTITKEYNEIPDDNLYFARKYPKVTNEKKLKFLISNIQMLRNLAKNNEFHADYKPANIGWENNQLMNVILLDYDKKTIINHTIDSNFVIIYDLEGKIGAYAPAFTTTPAIIPNYLYDSWQDKFRKNNKKSLYSKYSIGGLAILIEYLGITFKTNDIIRLPFYISMTIKFDPLNQSRSLNLLDPNFDNIPSYNKLEKIFKYLLENKYYL